MAKRRRFRNACDFFEKRGRLSTSESTQEHRAVFQWLTGGRGGIVFEESGHLLSLYEIQLAREKAKTLMAAEERR